MCHALFVFMFMELYHCNVAFLGSDHVPKDGPILQLYNNVT
jgi:hypothetical protein